MTIEIVDLTEGETIRAGPLRIRILEDGTHTNHRLGLVEVTIPPKVHGPPQHIHREHDETFFVVSGVATFTSGDEQVEIGPGMLITAPPGTPHTFANHGDAEVVMLCTVTPDLYIGYFRELATLPQVRQIHRWWERSWAVMPPRSSSRRKSIGTRVSPNIRSAAPRISAPPPALEGTWAPSHWEDAGDLLGGHRRGWRARPRGHLHLPRRLFTIVPTGDHYHAGMTAEVPLATSSAALVPLVWITTRRPQSVRLS